MRGVFAAVEENHPTTVMREVLAAERRLSYGQDFWGYTVLTVVFSVGAMLTTNHQGQALFALLGVFCGIGGLVALWMMGRGSRG